MAVGKPGGRGVEHLVGLKAKAERRAPGAEPWSPQQEAGDESC